MKYNVCNGQGQIIIYIYKIIGKEDIRKTNKLADCPGCNGTGKAIE